MPQPPPVQRPRSSRLASSLCRIGLASHVAVGLLACGHGEANRPWNDSSTRIRVEAIQSNRGQSAIEVSRQELSQAELKDLEGLAVVPTAGTCSDDTLIYAVTITDRDGVSRSYESVPGNQRCSGHTEILSVDPIANLLRARACTASNQTEGTGSAADAPRLVASNPCRHGVRSSEGGTTTWFRLAVTDRGRAHVIATELGVAAVDTELALFAPGDDPERDQPVATARANTSDAGSGAVLVRSLEQTGEYPLRVRARGQDQSIYLRYATPQGAGTPHAELAAAPPIASTTVD